MWSVRVSVAVAVAMLGGSQRSAPRELDARQILERTAKVYAECKTYRDSGVVNTLFIEEGQNRTVRKPFTTAFVRPGRFRYEFKNRRGEYEFDRYLVWGEGQDVRTWWDIQPGVEVETSLERALSAPLGVSSRSSYTIPDLLLGFTRGFPRATDPRSAARNADEEFEGSRCFVIAGGAPDGPLTLWIDQKTFLLRRIDERNAFDDFRTETTTTYEPMLDGEIPEALLVFDPPEPAQPPVVFAPARSLHGWDPQEPDAREILARMTKVYGECKSYRDSGVVTRASFLDRGRSTERMPFTTAFVRPGRFRYEVKCRRGEEEFDRCLVWRNDQDVCTWWDVSPGIERTSLSLAFAAAKVKTDFCAPTIPALLLPKEVQELPLTSLTDLERMQDDELDGAPCFVIQGGRWPGRSMTLWIDRKTFLLRKTVTLTQDIQRTETTTTYEPELDAEIPESLLVFDPPVPAAR